MSGSSTSLRWFLFLIIFLPLRAAAEPQQEPLLVPPETFPFDSQLAVLDFTHPTPIQGRIRMVEATEQAVWFDWDDRLEEGASGTQRWVRLEGDFLILLHAKDQEQFAKLKDLRPGTRIQFIVQAGEGGRRIILSVEEPTTAPRIPL